MNKPKQDDTNWMMCLFTNYHKSVHTNDEKWFLSQIN